MVSRKDERKKLQEQERAYGMLCTLVVSCLLFLLLMLGGR